MSAPTLPTALALLAAEPNVAADAALVEALPHLDPEVQAAALELLGERGHQPSLTAIVGRFNEYDEALRSRIVQHVGAVFAGVRKAISSTTFQDRAGAIELIVQSQNTKLVYLLADTLRSTCPRTRALAASGLHDMTKGAVDAPGRRVSADELMVLGELAEGLADALGQAVMTWEIHLEPKVLKAALWLGERTEQAIRKKLTQPRTTIAAAISDMLVGTSDPLLAKFAWRALTIAELRSSAARAIGLSENDTFVRALLAQSWLLLDPKIARAARHVRDNRWLFEHDRERRRFDDVEADQAVRVLTATGPGDAENIGAMRSILEEDGLEAQRAVLWALIADRGVESTKLLTLVACRSGNNANRLASGEIQRRHADEHITTEPAGSDRNAIPPARRAFERYWQQIDALTPDETASLAKAMRPIADDLVVAVRAKLAGADPLHRARALRLVSDLGLVSSFDEQIYRLSRDPNSLVRSVAVRLLGKLGSSTCRRILRASVDDGNERVQANAIESLDRLDADERIECTTTKLDSSSSRVRANAVKSLLRTGLARAGDVLIEMLEDPASARRMSALWVVEQVGLRSAGARLAQLAHEDPVERVRLRARNVGRVLDSAFEASPLERRRGKTARMVRV